METARCVSSSSSLPFSHPLPFPSLCFSSSSSSLHITILFFLLLLVPSCPQVPFFCFSYCPSPCVPTSDFFPQRDVTQRGSPGALVRYRRVRQAAVLRFRFVDEHLDAAAKVGTHHHVPPARLFALLHERLVKGDLNKKKKTHTYTGNCILLRRHRTTTPLLLTSLLLAVSSGSSMMIASGFGAKIAHVTVALCALMPSQKSLRSRRTCNRPCFEILTVPSWSFA